MDLKQKGVSVTIKNMPVIYLEGKKQIYVFFQLTIRRFEIAWYINAAEINFFGCNREGAIE